MPRAHTIDAFAAAVIVAVVSVVAVVVVFC